MINNIPLWPLHNNQHTTHLWPLHPQSQEAIKAGITTLVGAALGEQVSTSIYLTIGHPCPDWAIWQYLYFDNVGSHRVLLSENLVQLLVFHHQELFLPLDHNQECFERTACRLGEYAKDIPGESESWSESFLLGGRYWKSKSELYSGRKWKAKTYSLIIFPGKDILFVVLDRFFPSSWVKSLDISREVILHLHHLHHHMTM